MHMSENNLTLREGRAKDEKIAKKMWCELFKDSERENDYYFENIYDDKNLSLGEIKKSKKIVTLLHKNPYILVINKKEFPTYYFVGIGTNLEDQGKGYMDQLLRYSLRKSKDNKKDIIFLMPIDSRIYKKYGFGYISNLEIYKTKCERVSQIKIPKNINIEQITSASQTGKYGELSQIYDKRTQSFLVKLKRDNSYYENIVKESEILNGRIYIIYEKEIPMGYFIFYLIENKILVREIILLNTQYYKMVISFISRLINYYEKIEIMSQENSNLNFYVDNQLDITKEIKPFIMARILEPLNILNGLSLKFDKQNIDDIKIFIEDDILEENTGIYSISKDKIHFTKKNLGDYHFKTNIENLSSMILGYFNLNEMRELNKIEINHKYFEKINKNSGEIIEKINLMFANGINYIQEYQ